MPILLMGFLSTFSLTANGVEQPEQKTDVEVNITYTSEEKEPPEKGNIFDPDEAKPVKILPSTGEVLTTFVYVIIGLSILTFVLGILINRTIKLDIEWESDH